MTADEIFETLGYEKVEDDRNCIIYINRKEDKHLELDLFTKQFGIHEFGWGNFDFEYVTMQELKAINKKCEELRWDV